MRTLIYNINYFPELIGIGKCNAEMAEWLADHGYEVAVITALPYYSWWRTQSPFRFWAHHTEQINKVEVCRCPLWVPGKPTGIKSQLHSFPFALNSIPLLLSQLYKRPDIIVVLEPTLFCVLAALGLALLSGTRTWLHVQDFEVDAALELGIVNAKTVAPVAKNFELAL